jgi:hypothetical protein
VISLLLATAPGFAEDWGFFSIIPVSAPRLVLEAVVSGTAEGTVVSISQPTTEANQKWVVQPKRDGLYVIGDRPQEKTMLETMIAGKEMPVIVGVFVRPRGRSCFDERHARATQS